MPPGRRLAAQELNPCTRDTDRQTRDNGKFFAFEVGETPGGFRSRPLPQQRWVPDH